jgi:hypothetical protein
MIRFASRSSLFAAALVASITPCLTAQGTATPRTGSDVLEAMRAAYAGKWYHTLTFTQTTTLRGKDGTEQKQTWHETLAHTAAAGTRLRIDFGDLSAGNGVIYTADSSFRVKAGKLQSADASGNEFLPLIEGVYVQPVAKTVKELGEMKVDLSRVRTGTWEGKPVWIVGAASASDTTSPQFWVDTDRKLLQRMVVSFAAGQPPYDVHLGGYEKVGNGAWLATKIEMFQGGVRRQAEDYAGWKVDIPVDPALFDPAQWSTAKHWAKTAK